MARSSSREWIGESEPEGGQRPQEKHGGEDRALHCGVERCTVELKQHGDRSPEEGQDRNNQTKGALPSHDRGMRLDGGLSAAIYTASGRGLRPEKLERMNHSSSIFQQPPHPSIFRALGWRLRRNASQPVGEGAWRQYFQGRMRSRAKAQSNRCPSHRKDRVL